jgi:hypothetical protein
MTWRAIPETGWQFFFTGMNNALKRRSQREGCSHGSHRTNWWDSCGPCVARCTALKWGVRSRPVLKRLRIGIPQWAFVDSVMDLRIP